ncbi:unnamed protein product [Ambrosiozyma monospora]|uniref:Unnamed protein product n=1 Tax=Ambrosiozyma monospora TaxID=43982 RepID=A0ACB5U318_AMBMO|nr:unnamed protein product [Ambrosiozyma monospora]
MLIVYLTKFTDLDIDDKDPKGRTVLHWAAYQGDIFTVNHLIKCGASINMYDADGLTPLHWALVRNSRDCLISLLKAGADIKLGTRDGKSCTQVATDMGCTRLLKSALREIGINEQGEQLKFLFSEKTGKFVTFLGPYILLPVMLMVVTDGFLFFKFIFALSLMVLQVALISRHLCLGCFCLVVQIAALHI